MKELQGSSKRFQLFISKVHFLKKKLLKIQLQQCLAILLHGKGVRTCYQLCRLSRLSKTKCWLWAARPRPGYGIFSDEIRNRVKEAVGIL